ncbi:MAG: hypothetical protein AUK47_29010 [Deltaproteobacteria bacterium CG2_30_63_29]|nr:MAG: hypothetical protein AUK47_29010 [Deltaproteobacteria bacterium CG2_30_63_29]PIW00434.1 MAG: hypothetical protein COW42_07820 [Deltaproteobacteria bacterium CG17_big_fil_post_rev_8_21_14_2_50_63_7]PJB42136.1 MAG: hypothetical protein CO108_12185 [Deltaproteobacteria bacterium CG_4_9_14_3_um_filter_63_12]
MIKKLTPIGDLLGLIIDSSILELLRIDKDTALEVSTDGNSLTIKPIRSNRYQRPVEASSLGPDRSHETFQLVDDPSPSDPSRESTGKARNLGVIESPGRGTPMLPRPESEPKTVENPHAAEAFEKLHDVYVAAGLWKQLIALHTASREFADWNSLIAALKKMTQEEQNAPTKSEMIFVTARIWEERLDRLDEAMVLYQKAFSIDPHNIPALKSARSIYRQQRNWKMVQTLFHLHIKVINNPIERSAVTFELAELCLDQLHDQKKGREALERALQLDPNNQAARERLDSL